MMAYPPGYAIMTSADPMLVPYLAESETHVAEHLLSELLETHAAPVIRSAVMYRLGATQPGDVDDVCGEALLAVLRRIQKARDTGTEIADFRSYVAVVAYHACDAHVRSRQ